MYLLPAGLLLSVLGQLILQSGILLLRYLALFEYFLDVGLCLIDLADLLQLQLLHVFLKLLYILFPFLHKQLILFLQLFDHAAALPQVLGHSLRVCELAHVLLILSSQLHI